MRGKFLSLQMLQLTSFVMMLHTTKSLTEEGKQLVVLLETDSDPESGSGSQPKVDQFMLGSHLSCTANFLEVGAQLFELCWEQTNVYSHR